MRIRLNTLAVALGTVFVVSSLGWGTPFYHLTDIGVIAGATSSAAYAINDAGQVVGASGSDVILFSNGTLFDLGHEGNTPSEAVAINNNGLIAGFSSNTAGIHAFLHGQPPAGFNDPIATPNHSSGLGLNDSGLLVGKAGSTAYKFDGSNFTNLGTLAGDTTSTATAVNNSGEIVGSSVGFAASRAFVIAPNTTTLIDLGSTTSVNSGTSASAVNASGQIAGQSNGHAFLWTPGATDGVSGNSQMKDLGVLPGMDLSFGYGINDEGTVVGTCKTVTTITRYQAFVDIQGTMFNLNTLLDSSAAGWTLLDAYDVNNSGQVVGIGTINGQSRAFLLTPFTPGDANMDGHVDLNDLNIVLSNLGTTTSSWSSGNFDGAATIDLNDLNTVLNNLGVTTSPGTHSIAAADALLSPANVPEPTSLLLMIIGTATGLLGRKKK